MHDWILKKITFDWGAAEVVIELEDAAFTAKFVTATGVSFLGVPHQSEWGKSVNVNTVSPVQVGSSGLQELRIEMQSGDVISLIAERVHLPR